MNIPLLILAALFSLSIQGEASCDTCDMEILKNTQQHITQLNFEMIEDFLCTFDKSCRADLEFYRWSNETLFDLVYHSPDLFLRVLQYGEVKNRKVILEELSMPIHDGIDVEVVRNKVKAADEVYMFKNDVLSALN